MKSRRMGDKALCLVEIRTSPLRDLAALEAYVAVCDRVRQQPGPLGDAAEAHYYALSYHLDRRYAGMEAA